MRRLIPKVLENELEPTIFNFEPVSTTTMKRHQVYFLNAVKMHVRLSLCEKHVFLDLLHNVISGYWLISLQTAIFTLLKSKSLF
jgi:hypothetical protein